MARFTPACLCIFAAAFTLAAPACDPAELGEASTASPRTSPPYDPTPTDLAPAPPDECVCGQVDAPVCGVDGGTYPNDCEAGCAGVDVDYEGPCEEPQNVACDSDVDCANWQFCDTGVTCGGEGKCAVRPDLCTKIWAPVCGCDGETYGSECDAHVHGVSVAAEGECQTCVCPLVYKPVCGADGKTYGNECAAGCEDVAVLHEGECTGEPEPEEKLE